MGGYTKAWGTNIYQESKKSIVEQVLNPLADPTFVIGANVYTYKDFC